MVQAMIYVVRHGQTDENINRIIQGQNDTLLNSVGVEQAQAIAEALKDVNFDAIYTSDLKRAADTTRYIAKYHNDVPMNHLQLLRERHMGVLQGTSVGKTRTAAQEATIESIEVFTKRITDFWDDVLSTQLLERSQAGDDQTWNVLVVSHGAWISTMTRYLLRIRGIRDDRKPPHPGAGNHASGIRFCPNAGVTLFELNGDIRRLLKFGDISHLNKSMTSYGNSDEL